eukprot:TRINITY_DN9209_c0_g1_i5.p1 TRINITY_DN9209_c0_g1~~TRINITY_DN9209_c0_g1_i5.p1  ORF type:complete len:325 (+),score=83.04 TRINITY_DN9209_c0_g1_i5:816-1790(+)
MSIPIISHGERLFELNFPSLFDSDRNSPLHEQYKEGFRINFGNECLYNRNVELTDCLLQVWESEYFPNVPKSLDSKRELAEISLQSFDSLRGMNLVVCPYSPTKIELFRGLGLVLQPDTAFVISNNYNNTEDMRYTLHDISDDKGTDDGHMDSTTASEFENELAKVLDEHNKNSNSNDNDHGVVYAPDVVANKRRIMIGNDHILTLSPLFNALPHVCGNECVGIVNQVKAELEIIGRMGRLVLIRCVANFANAKGPVMKRKDEIPTLKNVSKEININNKREFRVFFNRNMSAMKNLNSVTPCFCGANLCMGSEETFKPRLKSRN